MKETLRKERFAVECPDGVVLRGMLIIPEQARAVIQFNGGTALRKEYYLPFLEFLAEQGFICCLWDYRGSGESAPKTLKGCDYKFSDYGVKDMPVIRRFLKEKYPDLPFLVVAHSVGGQQLGFMEDLEGIRGMIGFAVSTGYLGFMPLKFRLTSLYFFYLFSPLSIALTGYVASKRFGYMEDLPKNVVREWSTWCWTPHYFFEKKFAGKTVPEGKFKEYDFPVHLFWTSDDPIANKNSVPVYCSHIHSRKGVTVTCISPKDYKIKEIGHMGFFKRALKHSIWQQALDKLNAFLES